ncbi:hypothetical protein G3I76_42605, partial [Streptomyces sp. SID11233]|nr:hypothetical protein [Streptomyces sp. SID11233]
AEPLAHDATGPAAEPLAHEEAAAATESGDASKRKALGKALNPFGAAPAQGKRQLMAQKLYALAAGGDVPAAARTTRTQQGRARELVKAIGCTPQKMRLAGKDAPLEEQEAAWVASLQSAGQQKMWEEEIARQLKSD